MIPIIAAKFPFANPLPLAYILLRDKNMRVSGKQIQSAAIICNIGKEGIEGYIRRLAEILYASNVEWFIEKGSAELIGMKGFERESAPDVDIAFVLGGDGTMLSTARAIREKEIPILGINLGRLGFLTELDADEIETAVPEIIEGKYFVDSRMMLDILMPDNGIRRTALNEIVLDRGQSPRFVNLDIYVSGQLVAQVAADGLIVSTPTGSTAYNMSAGGAIMSPEMQAFQIITLSPYTLSIRPVVVGADEIIRVVYNCDSREMPRVSIDGQLGLEMPSRGEIIVQRAIFSAHFVHYHDRSFYGVLHRKLGWALPPGKSAKDTF